MAKWDFVTPQIGDWFFFSMYDNVTYLIPLEKRDEWMVWIGSNSPDVPEYATSCPGPFEMAFATPRIINRKRSP
jgi:hypothetical protein